MKLGPGPEPELKMNAFSCWILLGAASLLGIALCAIDPYEIIYIIYRKARVQDFPNEFVYGQCCNRVVLPRQWNNKSYMQKSMAPFRHM